jgi:pimeloyl-ACP methyl ester carboxylesterase
MSAQSMSSMSTLRTAGTIVALLFILAHAEAAEPTAFQVRVTGQGRPVIFIPGFTCPGSVWDATVDAIRADHSGLKHAEFSFFENAHHFVFFDEPDKWIAVLDSALDSSW